MEQAERRRTPPSKPPLRYIWAAHLAVFPFLPVAAIAVYHLATGLSMRGIWIGIPIEAALLAVTFGTAAGRASIPLVLRSRSIRWLARTRNGRITFVAVAAVAAVLIVHAVLLQHSIDRRELPLERSLLAASSVAFKSQAPGSFDFGSVQHVVAALQRSSTLQPTTAAAGAGQVAVAVGAAGYQLLLVTLGAGECMGMAINAPMMPTPTLQNVPTDFSGAEFAKWPVPSGGCVARAPANTVVMGDSVSYGTYWTASVSAWEHS